MKHSDYLKKKKTRETRKKIISVISAIVVFITTYALVLPAITLDVSKASQEPGIAYEQMQFKATAAAASVTAASTGEEAKVEEPAPEEPKEEPAEEIKEEPAETPEEETSAVSAEEEKAEETVEEAPAEPAKEEAPAEEPAEVKEEQKDKAEADSADAAPSAKPDSADAKTADTDKAADQASVDQSGTDAADKTDASAAATTAETTAEFKIPELDALDFDDILTGKTNFYYYHVENAEDTEEISSDSIDDWKKVGSDTVLAPEDFVRVYLSYEIPAGALNETNAVARYTLPAGLELSDKQIKAINKYENGIAASKSGSEKDKYLGAEAIEGSRTPDEKADDEYIAATVKVKKTDNGRQELVFTFIPYTVEKNQISYDEKGEVKSKGKEVKGFFTFDLTTSQIDFEETNTETVDKEDGTTEEIQYGQADVVFVKENKDKNIDEISRTLVMSAPAENEEPQIQEQKTLVKEGDDYTVTVSYTDETQIPDNATLEVSEIGKATPEYASYLEQAKGAVDDETKSVNEARFFDITILADGEKVEPQAPVNVQITFAGIEQTNTDDAQLLHYKDNEDVEIMDKAEFSKSEEQTVDTVQFETEGFSVYGIVGTELYTEITLPGSSDTYIVTVTAPAEAKIPQGSTLRVEPFEEGSEKYEYARKAVLADKKEKGEYVDIDDFNLAALDISIIGPDGNEIEPSATVKVDIKIKELPGVEDLSAIKDSLEIQHHVEVEDGVVVEKVFDGSIEGSFQMATDEKVVEEGTVVDPNSVTDEDFINMEPSEEIEASFDTDVFSTFTLSWRSGTRNVTVKYVDQNGNELNVTNTTPNNSTNGNGNNRFAYLIYDIDGYEYVRTDRVRSNGTTTSIRPELRYNDNNRWQYTTTTGTGDASWSELENGDTINVVYKPKTTPTQGGTPTLKPVSEGDKPDEPSILKESDPQADGTADLSLSITGHTKDREVEKLADVIVVMDISGSMKYDLAGTTEWRQNQYGQWYETEIEYGNNDSNQRLYQAKQAVNNLATELAKKKNSQQQPLVRMSLISFSNTADEEIGLTDLTDTGLTNYKNAVNSLNPDGGTNWEAALKLANEQAVDSGRATFVIFVTDGDPTFRLTRYGVTNPDLNGDISDSYYRAYGVFGAGSSDNSNRNFNAAVAQGTAIKSASKSLYTIGISNSVTKARNFNTSAGGDGAYIAANSAALTQAFSDIEAAIQAKMGISDVQMTDGITEMTQTVHKAGLTGTNGDFTYWKKAANSEEFVEWDPASERCEEATYDTASGAVKWNMGTNFMPEDGATYKVTWKVWPNQRAYDILAMCENDPTYYDSSNMTDEEREQITRSGEAPNYTYTLKTNEPGAGITYKDATKSGQTVTTEGDPKPLPFNTVDPLGLSSDTISIEKIWENELDGRNAGNSPITFTVKADNDVFGTISLGPDTWKADNYNISAGLMKTVGGQVIYEHGHDFTIVEPDNLAYYWDFKADVYHPMVIDNELVMLLKVDTEAESDYTIDGKYYKRSTHGATLRATNERRSYLNLSKEVVDQNGDPYNTDQAFTFTASITESRNEDVWFAVYDYNLPAPAPGQPDTRAIKDGTLVTRNDGEAIHYQDSDGFYSVPSGTAITITLKKGWNIRFINLHTGSSYTISESATDPEGFSFKVANASATNEGTAGTVSGRTTTGNIDKSNTDYSVVYTNKANVTTLRLRKVDEDGRTPLAGATVEVKKGPQAIDGSPFLTTTEDIELNLLDGVYSIKETNSPAGYVVLNGEMYFKTADGTVTITDQDGNEKTYDDFTMTTEGDVIVLKLKNHPGRELPMTGGSGTFLYTLSGITLIMASALMYGFRMRRRERRLN